MRETVNERDFARHPGIEKLEFRNVFDDRVGPLQPPFVHQHGERRGVERLGDRGDRKDRVGIDASVSAELCARRSRARNDVPVLHDRDGHGRHLPVVERLRGVGVEIGERITGCGERGGRRADEEGRCDRNDQTGSR